MMRVDLTDRLRARNDCYLRIAVVRIRLKSPLQRVHGLRRSRTAALFDAYMQPNAPHCVRVLIVRQDARLGRIWLRDRLLLHFNANIDGFRGSRCYKTE
jgi:hypothetical protein